MCYRYKFITKGIPIIYRVNITPNKIICFFIFPILEQI